MLINIKDSPGEVCITYLAPMAPSRSSDCKHEFTREMQEVLPHKQSASNCRAVIQADVSVKTATPSRGEGTSLS